MKKLIISILSVLVLAMTGCSCVPETSLTFKNNWTTSGEPAIGTTQTTTYSVSIDKNYKFENYSYEKSSTLADNLYDFKNGVYTQTLSVISKSDIPAELTGSDIVDEDLSYVLHLKTSFSIDAYYTYGDKTEEHYHDTIVTDAYFGNLNTSYTPIYTKTQANYSQLYVGESVSVKTVATTTTSVFCKNSYSITTKIGEAEPTTQTINNSYKKYIDNTQLLFVMRNVDVAKSEESQTIFALPTVSPIYETAQELAVTYFADSTEKFGEKEIPVRCMSFGINTTNNSGRSQLVFVQNSAVESFNNNLNNSVMMKYVEPLMTYGTFESMGALVYTLTSIA